MTVLRAHFDGKFFVPDDPVNLPKGSPVELHVRELDEDEPADLPIVMKNGLPVICPPPGAPTITLEDVKRAEDEL